MSHTDPPFLYQYVGDQVRIIQVLGDDPLVTKSSKNMEDTVEISDGNVNNNKDSLDQKESTANENAVKTIEPTKTTSEDTLETKDPIEKTIDLKQEYETTPSQNDFNEVAVLKTVESITESDKCNSLGNIMNSKEISFEKTNAAENNTTAAAVNDNLVVSENNMNVEITDKKLDQETVSIDASLNENNSAESGDDEASFGTPENSPKSKRKLAKGKYGKGKAPPPPIVDNVVFPKENNDIACLTTSQESLVDFVNRMPNTDIKESGTFNKETRCLRVVNPIAENKRRHKSKSPGNIPKGNLTTISKLLQLPGKLAFWNKNDETNKSKSDVSEISDHSRRSSNIDQGVIDEFQSCADLSKITFESNERTNDQINFQNNLESEDITQDIIDKSDALQKLIEAKIESHPEYKIVGLHAEIPTTSKSTDV